MNPNLPIIVGESNPYGDDPHYAMYPEPDGCAGWRLCHLVMGLRRRTYMSSFERANLLQGPKWIKSVARDTASALRDKYDVLILLGTRVHEAFGFKRRDGLPKLIISNQTLMLLPHPSGRCRLWTDRMIFDCRGLLQNRLPNIPFGEIDHLPLPEDVPHLFQMPPMPVGMYVEVKFTGCTSCVNEPDYRGPCDCTHAPCVHQQPAVTGSG